MLVCRVKWNFVGRLRIPKKPDRPMISQIIEQSVFKQVSGPWHISFFTSMLGGKVATIWLFIFVCVEKNLKTIISYINAHTYVHTHRRKEKITVDYIGAIFYAILYICIICVCEFPCVYIRFIQWEVKPMKSLGDWTAFLGGKTKWSNCLKRLTSCEAIGAVPGSNSFHFITK